MNNTHSRDDSGTRRMLRNPLAVAMLGVAALTVGCAAPRLPEGTPTALMRVTSNGGNALFRPICGRDLEWVQGGLINNPFSNEVSPVRMYGTRTDKNNLVIERAIPAERPFGLLVNGALSAAVSGRRDLNCGGNVVFNPVEGAQYHVVHEWLGGYDTCQISVYRLTQEISGEVRRTRVPTRKDCTPS